MKKEEELDDEIITQIHKREEENSALRKILENLDKKNPEANKRNHKKKSFIKNITSLFQKNKITPNH